jgi:hypothetical protein
VGEPLGFPRGLEAELVFPVAEQQKEQNNEQAVASDPKLIVSALQAELLHLSISHASDSAWARLSRVHAVPGANRAAPAAVSPAAVLASRRTKTARDAYGQADYRLPAWVFNANRSDSLRSVMTATLRALK